MLGLTRILKDVHYSIGRLIDAINENSRLNRNHRGPAETNLQVSFRTPPALDEYFAAENTERPQRSIRNSVRLVIEGAGLIAILFGGVYAWRTFGEVKRQADYAQEQLSSMRNQLEATNRPWIQIMDAIVSEPLKFDNNQARIGVVLAIRNIGHSPAVHIIPQVKLVMPKLDQMPGEAIKQQHLTCTPDPVEAMPLTLFPNQSSADAWPFALQVSFAPDLDGGIFSPPDSKEKFVQPMIVGCIDYRIAGSDNHHQTGFIYQLVHARAAGLPIKVGVDMASAELKWEAYHFGGFDIN
jgi:hypothetical protein